MSKLEEIKNKQLMISMWITVIVSALFYFGIVLLASYALEEEMLLGTIITVSTIVFIVSMFLALKIELNAGYYDCKNCHNKFVPTYLEGLIAPHIHTTRYLKCSKCNKRTWCKKVMTKE